MYRRFSPFTYLLAVTLLSAIWGGALAGPEPAVGGSPPLILISIDGYRADYLDRGHSPVLAALADDGVRASRTRSPEAPFPLPRRHLRPRRCH